MRYDIFVSVPFPDRDVVELVRRRFPGREVYSPLEQEGFTATEYSEAVQNSAALLALITSGAGNVVGDLNRFHQYHARHRQERLENIVSVVEEEADVEDSQMKVLAAKGQVEDNLEGAFDLLSDYLTKLDDQRIRQMYRQNVPVLDLLCRLQYLIVKVLERWDRLRQ